MPDPTRDALDRFGCVITKAEAEAWAELVCGRREVLALRAGYDSLDKAA